MCRTRLQSLPSEKCRRILSGGSFLHKSSNLAGNKGKSLPLYAIAFFLVHRKRCFVSNSFLAQSAVFFALGHRKRVVYAFAHLTPKKHYQRFFPAKQGRAARPSVPTASSLHRSSKPTAHQKSKSPQRNRRGLCWCTVIMSKRTLLRDDKNR